jgi:hypothetical protein
MSSQENGQRSKVLREKGMTCAPHTVENPP